MYSVSSVDMRSGGVFFAIVIVPALTSIVTNSVIIICFFIALPSVPGFWGLWEAGGVFALSLFGVSANDAAGFTLANHAIQMIPVILVGFVSAVFTGVNIWRVAFEERVA